jgi:hypothetical protein
MPTSKPGRPKSPKSKSPKSRSPKSPKSKSPKSKSRSPKSNENQLMKFMQTNELAVYFVIFSMFYGIDIRKLNKMKISENDFNEICDYLKENQLSDLIPQLHFILPMVEVLILHSKSHDTMVIKRLFRLFGLEHDIDTFMKLFKSKSSTSTDIRVVDEFSPKMEILRQKGGSGVLTLFKKMKITKDFYTFLSFISLLLSMYCIWIQATRLLRDVEKNENIQMGLRLAQSAHACEGVELTSNQKLKAKIAGTISGLFGPNGEEYVKGIMYLSECLSKDPIKLDMEKYTVDIINNEMPNDEGTTNELVPYNVNDFVMSSGVVPFGFDFDKEKFHDEMNDIKRAVEQNKLSDSELKRISDKIAEQILTKQPLIASRITDSMKEQNIQPEKNIKPVIPRESSYLELVYDVVNEGIGSIGSIDFARIAAGYMTGEDLNALFSAQIRRYILKKRFELKDAQIKTEYFIDSLLIDLPLYLGTAYALLNYIRWFCGNLITFSYLVSTYFKKPQLAITNGDDNHAIEGRRNTQRITSRINGGGKSLKINHTKKSHKK